MKFRGILVAASALLLLSACSTYHAGDKDKGCPFGQKSCPFEKAMDNLPTGYSGQNRTNLLKPGETQRLQLSMPQESAPQQQPAPVQASDDVTVYPLDGDAVPAPITTAASTGQTAQFAAPDYYGEMVYQTFFLHGSSHLTGKERSDIGRVAGDIKQQPNQVAVTVVGHASHRVNGTTDPVQVKMINFEMAQKRANAVTAVLHDAGVSPSWVQAVSKGDDEPNPAPGARGQEAADRRVEIYLGGK